jgi:hypothetical protein
VLLLSYWNNPDEVSASLDSYREYEQLRKHFDTTMVTHARNAFALRKSGIPNSEVIYINAPILDRLHDLFLGKVLNYNYGSLKLTAFLIPYYIVYEFVIWSRLRSKIKTGRFALVHRMDPVSPVLASPLSWLMRNLKTPFSLGPLTAVSPGLRGTAVRAAKKNGSAFSEGFTPICPLPDRLIQTQRLSLSVPPIPT